MNRARMMLRRSISSDVPQIADENHARDSADSTAPLFSSDIMSHNAVLQMQRTHGNHATQNMVQRTMSIEEYQRRANAKPAPNTPAPDSGTTQTADPATEVGGTPDSGTTQTADPATETGQPSYGNTQADTTISPEPINTVDEQTAPPATEPAQQTEFEEIV